MKTRNEAGQALIFAIVAMAVVLMGFAGLGIDLGYLRYEKRLLQTAADGAAMSGAAEILYGSSGITSAAQHDAASNGFADTSGTTGCPSAIGCVSVAVHNPPTSGPNQTAAFVEVVITSIQPTFFMRVLGINSESISARAVATNSSSNGCLYTVGKSGNGILLNGFLDGIAANNCGIMDDANMTVSAFLSSVTASSIGVAGTYTAGFATVTPTPVTGVLGGTDPLAYLTAPLTGGACIPNPNLSGGGGTFTMNPGNYCTGITLGGSRNVVFNPGVYTITGGGGFLDTGSGSLTGTGVMFYNTTGNLTIGSGNTISLTAPTASNSLTGAVAGMLFWQSASDTSTVTLQGNLFSTLTGIIYAPGAQLNIPAGGANASAAYTIVVVKSVQLNGLNLLSLSGNTTSLTGGSPIKNITLVE